MNVIFHTVQESSQVQQPARCQKYVSSPASFLNAFARGQPSTCTFDTALQLQQITGLRQDLAGNGAKNESHCSEQYVHDFIQKASADAMLPASKQ